MLGATTEDIFDAIFDVEDLLVSTLLLTHIRRLKVSHSQTLQKGRFFLNICDPIFYLLRLPSFISLALLHRRCEIWVQGCISKWWINREYIGLLSKLTADIFVKLGAGSGGCMGVVRHHSLVSTVRGL